MDWIQVFTIIGVITAMIGLSTTGLYFAIRRNADEIRSIRSEMIAIRSEMKDGFKHINDRMDRHLEYHAYTKDIEM